MLTTNDYDGAHPYGASRDTSGHVIFYCYYTPIYCPPLRKPDNGELTPACCGERNRNKFNDTCSVTCNPGYIPVNPAGQMTTCLDDGSWKNPLLTGCKRSLNVTASPGTELTITSPVLNPTKTVSIQPSTQAITSTPVISNAATFAVLSVSGQQSSLSVSATFYSSVVQASHSSMVLLLSTSGKLQPTVPGVSSSIPPRGVEARSLQKILFDSKFLVGTAAGALLLLVIIIVLLVVRRRLQNAPPRRETGVKVYMSEVEKSFSMEDPDSGREVMMKTSTSQENLLYDSLSMKTLECGDKFAENPLYESCSHRFSVTKIEDNVLYESMSFIDKQENDKDLGRADHQQ